MTSALQRSQMDVRIRPANSADLSACAAIINDYIDETPWLPRTNSRQAMARMFAPELLEKRIISVAEQAGEIVGYVSTDPQAGFVHALYLRPEYCGRGLGRALLDTVKAARPQGFELTVYEPNIDAMRFYVREGLIEIPEGRKTDTEEGVPTLLMRWPGDSQ